MYYEFRFHFDMLSAARESEIYKTMFTKTRNVIYNLRLRITELRKRYRSITFAPNFKP